MATVISNLTRINDLEGGLTSVAIGGGVGAAANTDIFIQGAQSLARRQSNTTLTGFLLDDGTSNDLSADNVHIGAWLWHTHYSVLTDLRFRIADNASSNNYDEHIIPLSEYPSTGGWTKVWIDISRTPNVSGGTGLNESTARYFGPVNSLPAVGGNAANLVLDAIDQTTTGLSLTGTSGSWNDFLVADEQNTTNKYGVVTSLSDIIYCKARLTLGTSDSLSFDDSNFVIIFPVQSLVSSNFMGITINLTNPSTSINWDSGVINSAAVTGNTGDLIVENGVGDFNVNACTLTNIRVVNLTSGCTFTNTTIQNSGKITLNGATLDTCTISNSKDDIAVTTTNLELIDSCTFNSDGTGHAIEITVPGTYTLNNTFVGYASGTSGNTGNEVIYNNSGGLVTINVIGGTSPSYRNGTGATTVVNNTASLTLTNLVNPSEVRVFDFANPRVEIGGSESVTSGTYTIGIDASTYPSVNIAVMDAGATPPVKNIFLSNIDMSSGNVSIQIQQQIDRQYDNP
jgi:hypothetical protein